MQHLNFQVTAGYNVSLSRQGLSCILLTDRLKVCLSFSFMELVPNENSWCHNQDGSFTRNNGHASRTIFRTVTAVIVERLHTRVPASLMSCGHSSTVRGNGSFTVNCYCNIRPACSFGGGCGISSL